MRNVAAVEVTAKVYCKNIRPWSLLVQKPTGAGK
jgi:hypothetical protein